MKLFIVFFGLVLVAQSASLEELNDEALNTVDTAKPEDANLVGSFPENDELFADQADFINEETDREFGYPNKYDAATFVSDLTALTEETIQVPLQFDEEKEADREDKEVYHETDADLVKDSVDASPAEENQDKAEDALPVEENEDEAEDALSVEENEDEAEDALPVEENEDEAEDASSEEEIQSQNDIKEDVQEDSEDGENDEFDDEFDDEIEQENEEDESVGDDEVLDDNDVDDKSVDDDNSDFYVEVAADVKNEKKKCIGGC